MHFDDRNIFVYDREREAKVTNPHIFRIDEQVIDTGYARILAHGPVRSEWTWRVPWTCIPDCNLQRQRTVSCIDEC